MWCRGLPLFVYESSDPTVHSPGGRSSRKLRSPAERGSECLHICATSLVTRYAGRSPGHSPRHRCPEVWMAHAFSSSCIPRLLPSGEGGRAPAVPRNLEASLPVTGGCHFRLLVLLSLLCPSFVKCTTHRFYLSIR